jgi:hypothetical protein
MNDESKRSRVRDAYDPDYGLFVRENMEKVEELDRQRVEALCAAILEPLRANYLRGPISRERCFESLNALAVAAAIVIKGADGPGGEAHEFFNKALTQQIK